MADPLSIIASTLSVADVCFRLGTFLKQAIEGSQKIDEDLETLSKEIAALSTVNKLIKSSFEADLARTVATTDQSTITNLWHATNTTLGDCREILEKLDGLVSKIFGSGSSRPVAKLDGLRKYLRKLSKEEEFTQLRQKLNAYQATLQMILTAVDM